MIFVRRDVYRDWWFSSLLIICRMFSFEPRVTDSSKNRFISRSTRFDLRRWRIVDDRKKSMAHPSLWVHLERVQSRRVRLIKYYFWKSFRNKIHKYDYIVSDVYQVPRTVHRMAINGLFDRRCRPTTVAHRVNVSGRLIFDVLKV